MKTWDLTQKTPTEPLGNEVPTESVRVYNEETGKWEQKQQIKLVDDLEALRVRIDANLQIIKGELDDPQQGVDYFGIILANTPLQMKVQEISRVVMNIPGVSSITLTEAKQNPKTSTLSMRFLIQSVYGELDYNKSFEVGA